MHIYIYGLKNVELIFELKKTPLTPSSLAIYGSLLWELVRAVAKETYVN